MCCIIKWIHLKKEEIVGLATLNFSNLKSHWKRLCTACMTERHCLCQGDIHVQKGKSRNSFKYIIFSFSTQRLCSGQQQWWSNEWTSHLSGSSTTSGQRHTQAHSSTSTCFIQRIFSAVCLFMSTCRPLICACVCTYPLSMYKVFLKIYFFLLMYILPTDGVALV